MVGLQAEGTRKPDPNERKLQGPRKRAGSGWGTSGVEPHKDHCLQADGTAQGGRSGRRRKMSVWEVGDRSTCQASLRSGIPT